MAIPKANIHQSNTSTAQTAITIQAILFHFFACVKLISAACILPCSTNFFTFDPSTNDNIANIKPNCPPQHNTDTIIAIIALVLLYSGTVYPL